MKEGLTPRQFALKRWLDSHYISNKYWTIEEIVSSVYLPTGEKAYTLNTDLKKHDKCIELSNDVRAINWNISQGFQIIIKDSKGSIKYAENELEFNKWREHEIKKLEPKWQYLNNLKWKSDRDGQIPLLNQALNENTSGNVTKVFKHKNERIVKGGKFDGMTFAEFLLAGMKEKLEEGE